MPPLTPQQLARCTGARIDRATEWLPYIQAAMAEFKISTPQRSALWACSRWGH